MQGASPAHSNGFWSTLRSRQCCEDSSNLPILLQERRMKDQTQKETPSQSLAVDWWWWVALLICMHLSQSRSNKSTLPIASSLPEEMKISLAMEWSKFVESTSESFLLNVAVRTSFCLNHSFQATLWMPWQVPWPEEARLLLVQGACFGVVPQNKHLKCHKKNNSNQQHGKSALSKAATRSHLLESLCPSSSWTLQSHPRHWGWKLT